jgi:N-dimethylarginine dimethylaminohydrolase
VTSQRITREAQRIAETMNEYGQITRIVLKHARDAFASQSQIDRQWRDLRFTAAPEFVRACREYDAFVEAIAGTGAAIDYLPPDARTTLDSMYVRDASLTTNRGVILCAMGKPQRLTEPDAMSAACSAVNLPVIGRIVAPGRVEGGDVVWLDDDTVVVGRGYRTNDAGIEQLRTLLGPSVDVIVVPLPHWTGVGDVMHLMSLLSPVDAGLAVVYSRLLPVPFREWLLGRGLKLVEVPDEEFDSMGTNVLALGPRRCLMIRGNPSTKEALERAGATVIEYEGTEISVKGAGGPTCLTRPIARAASNES